MQHKIRVEIKGEFIVLLKPSTETLSLYSELRFREGLVPGTVCQSLVCEYTEIFCCRQQKSE
jgi:hypothetical protein